MTTNSLSLAIAHVWAQLAHWHYRAERFDRAIPAYERALGRYNDRQEWHVLLARAYDQVGNVEAAAREYEVALRATTGPFSAPKNLFAIVALISALSEKGKHDAAAALRAALKRNLGLDQMADAPPGSHGIKIAYVPNTPVPDINASCVHAMKLCDALGDIGRDVILVSNRSEGERWSNAHEVFDFFGVEDVELLLFDSSGYTKLDDFTKIRMALDAGATHCLTRSPISAYYAALAGLPTVLEMHTPFKPDSLPLVKDLLAQPAFRELVVTTLALKRIMEKDLPGLTTPVEVVQNAADSPSPDVADFAFQPIEGTDFQVGYSGHLYPGKGLEIVLRLAQELPRVGFHILGGRDPDIAFWKEKAGDLPNVRFYGFRPQSEVSGFLRQIDAAIAPYLKQVSVFGGAQYDQSLISSLKLFEYMAHDLAIVTSDLPTFREVLRHGENALLCDPDDFAAWRAAIEQLEGDEELRNRLARNARADFDANYTWDKRAARLVTTLGI